MRKVREYRYVVASFLISFFFLLFMFFMKSVAPFGGSSTTMYDSMHQYVPFLATFYDKIFNHSSLQYTLSSGLGQDFTYIAGYYLCSPWNILILLLGRDNLFISINIITLIKMALCSLTFSYFLQKTFRRRNILLVPFGLCYAFSSYVLAYYYNIMWMDILYMFPIVILCFNKMQKGEKNGWIKYIVALAFSIFSNFYLAIPLCLFLVLLFLTENFTRKNILAKTLRFSVFSLWAGIITAGITVPIAYHFSTLGKNSTNILKDVKVLENFFDFISRGLTFTETQVDMSFKSGGNIYCGTIALVVLFIYIFNNTHPISERIKRSLLVLFLFISMNVSTLNFIWHGLAKPTGYVNRFSFIFIFMILTMAYDTLLNIRKIDNYKVIIPMVFSNSIVFELLLYQWRMGKLEDYLSYFIATIIFMVAFDLIIVLHVFKKLNKVNFYKFVTVVMLVETLIYTGLEFREAGFITINDTYLNEEDYKSLVATTTNMDDSFYRSDSINCEFGNEPMYYAMNGVEVFTSTASSEILNSVGNMGFRSGSNFMSVKGLTPLSSILLNVKYIYGNNALTNYLGYTESDFSGKVSRYTNKYDTQYAYLVDDTISEYAGTSYNKLANQNELASKLTNNYVESINSMIPANKIQIEIGSNECGGQYKAKEKSNSPETVGVEYTKNTSGIYELKFSYVCDDDSDLAIQIDPSHSYACNVKVNDHIYITDYKISNEIVTVTGLKEGDIVTYNQKIEASATEGDIYATFAKTNMENMDKLYEYLTDSDVTVNSVKDGYFSATTTSIKDRTLFVSVPYSKGWTAYVDGEKTEITDLSGFIGLSLNAGAHDIELKYSTPYLTLGIIISFVSILCLVLLYVRMNKHKIERKKVDE